MAMDRRRIIAPPLLLLILLLSTAAGPSLAQQSNGTSGGFTPTTVIVLVVLVGAFFVLTFFSIYINRCAPPRPPPHRASHADYQNAAPAPADHRRPRSLEKELVESFPTAVYGDVKALGAARSGPLECAVCLAEFEDHDELRVLPACCHVFHPDCIDPWLAAAVTCPLCRSDLTAPPPAQPAAESCELTPRGEAVQEEDDDEARLAGAFTPESLISFGAARPHEFHYRRTQSAMDMPDRHTLRLPEHVMKDLAAVRRHRRAASLAGYPDAVERTPRWLTSFWRSVSWQRQSRAETDAAGEEHGGIKRVVPITETAAEETPSGSGSGSGGNEKERPDDDALNRV